MKGVHSQAHIRPVPNVMNCTSGFCGAFQLFIWILSIIYKSILVLFLANKATRCASTEVTFHN